MVKEVATLPTINLIKNWCEWEIEVTLIENKWNFKFAADWKQILPTQTKFSCIWQSSIFCMVMCWVTIQTTPKRNYSHHFPILHQNFTRKRKIFTRVSIAAHRTQQIPIVCKAQVQRRAICSIIQHLSGWFRD